MKPLPLAVQSAFPCAPDRLPERPWWCRAGGQCLRADMGGLSRPLNDVLLEGHDAKNPLPHPGYRAGQVWADDVGRSVVCASERGTFLSGVVVGPLSLDAAGYRYLMADPACPHLAPWSPAEQKGEK